ncbi:MAG: hypothetical protein SFU86_01695 [Pirellulaceae bacterium]|nr:hypothetical protein [Pirellulaceae bacterium]
MRRIILLVGLAGLALAGCDLPVSVHPISDDKSSALDERLLGQWEFVVPADAERDPKAAPPRWLIARAPGRERTHEIAYLELDGENQAQLRRFDLYCLSLGDRHFLSIPTDPTAPKEKRVYWLGVYEFVNDDLVKFMVLNKDLVAPAIDREELAGSVVKAVPDPNASPAEQVKPKYKSIKITAEPAELRAWLAKQGPALGNPSATMSMRRIEVK